MTIEEILQSLRDCDYAECKEWADAIEAAMRASDREYLDLMDRRDEAVMQAAHLRIALRERRAEIERLRGALSSMLMFYGMDEEKGELSEVIHNKARAALAEEEP